MLKSFGGLTQQMFEKPFKNMLFSVYNFAEEEFYIHKLRSFGYDCDIDDLEYMTIDKNGANDSEVGLFKNYIEDEIQNGKPIVGILLYKGKNGSVPVVVKPKNVDITSILKG